MKFSVSTQLVVLATVAFAGSSVITTADAFQVDTKSQQAYKGVVEKSLTQQLPRPPINIVDDTSYLPPDEDHYFYWFDNRIHVFGNTGFLGGLHAFVAPFATRAIDDAAYEGEDVRTMVSHQLSNDVLGPVKSNGARICDLCSGVGISTRALQKAFPDAETIVGVDTSPEMISMARWLTNHVGGVRDVARIFSKLRADTLSFFTSLIDRSNLMKNRLGWSNRPVYAQGNAEKTVFEDDSFDLVTIMYGFHEVPRLARNRIASEARRILVDGGQLAIIDIASDYDPSPAMLSGEPYVLEYKKNIHQQMESLPGFVDYTYQTIVPGHVGMWILTANKSSS
jgi:ubiquinone/menaquinone biosynthesis C-methylase UbiE